MSINYSDPDLLSMPDLDAAIVLLAYYSEQVRE
jgi:hypothetical protein